MVVIPDADDVSVDVSASTRVLLQNLSQTPIWYTFDAAAATAAEWFTLDGARADLINDLRNRTEIEKGAAATLYIRGMHRLVHVMVDTLADANEPPRYRQRVLYQLT